MSHAGAPLAVIGATLDGERVGLRAIDGHIVALGPGVVAEPGDDVLDAADHALLPGLVNAHTHAAMTLFRGFGDDLPLMQWLREKIWPAEAHLTPDDVYWGTRLACVEMLKAGITCFWDMYWHGTAAARAVVDSNLRAVVSSVVIDGGSAERGQQLRAGLLEGLEALTEVGPLVTASLGPHAIYTVSIGTLEWLGEVSAERGVPVQIHLSETVGEVNDCLRAHGVRPAELLDQCGLLTERTVLAHGVWLDDAELDLIAERGATLVTVPVSNLKLAVGGVFPYGRARRLGIGIGLGTDGASSNNGLDVLADAKILALLEKHAQHDPAAMPASEALAVITGARAPRLGGAAPLRVGGPADFVLVRTSGFTLGPGDQTTNLVYAAGSTAIDTVVVAGRVVMRGRVVDEEAEIATRAFECARRLGVEPAPLRLDTGV